MRNTFQGCHLQCFSDVHENIFRLEKNREEFKIVDIHGNDIRDLFACQLKY